MPSPKFIQDLHQFTCKHGRMKASLVNGTLVLNTMMLVTEQTEVRVNPQTQALEIRARQSQNPVLMVTDDGRIFRYHGEFQNVSTHLWSLLTPPGEVT